MLGLSSYPLNQLRDEQLRIESAVKSAQSKMQKEERNYQRIETEFQKSSISMEREPLKLSDYVNKFNVGVRDVARDYDLEVARISMGAESNATEKEVTTLGTPFAQAPSMKVISAILQGTYTDTEQLKNFIDMLRAQHVAISKVHIRNNTFQITVELYGV